TSTSRSRPSPAAPSAHRSKPGNPRPACSTPRTSPTASPHCTRPGTRADSPSSTPAPTMTNGAASSRCTGSCAPPSADCGRRPGSALAVQAPHPGDRGDPALLELVLASHDPQLARGHRVGDDGGLAHQGVDGLVEVAAAHRIVVDQRRIDI